MSAQTGDGHGHPLRQDRPCRDLERRQELDLVQALQPVDGLGHGRVGPRQQVERPQVVVEAEEEGDPRPDLLPEGGIQRAVGVQRVGDARPPVIRRRGDPEHHGPAVHPERLRQRLVGDRLLAGHGLEPPEELERHPEVERHRRRQHPLGHRELGA
jgi:hypothetical protein